MTVVQTTTFLKNGSPSENTQQCTKIGRPNEAQEEGDEGNVNALLKTPQATINVFKTFDWVTKEGWPCMPKKQS